MLKLINASRDAELPVVGSRGQLGFPALRLGATSAKIANYASCPIVIMPPARLGKAGPRRAQLSKPAGRPHPRNITILAGQPLAPPNIAGNVTASRPGRRPAPGLER